MQTSTLKDLHHPIRYSKFRSNRKIVLKNNGVSINHSTNQSFVGTKDQKQGDHALLHHQLSIEIY